MVISNYTENESVEILYFLICCLCIPFISICVQFVCGTISDYCQLPIGKRHFFISLGKLFWIIGRCIAIGCSIYPVILIWKSNENVKRNESEEMSTLSQENTFYLLSEIGYFVGYIIYIIGENMIEISYRSYIVESYEDKYQNKVWILSMIMTILGHLVYSLIYLLLTLSFKEINDKNNEGMISIVLLVCEIIPLLVVPILLSLFTYRTDDKQYIQLEKSKIGYWKNLFNSFKGINRYIILILLFLFVGSFVISGFKGKKNELYYNYLFKACDQ